jgi:carbamate kinase
MEKRLRIFALGGNEVSPTGEYDIKTGKYKIPNLAEQWKRTSNTCDIIAQIIKSSPDDYYILTHGNGPQVGNIILRAEYSKPILHPLPLDVCDADTQGAMGYMLAQLTNSLRIINIDRIVAETVTRVVVDQNDKDFENPTKFIGPSYKKEEAEKIQKEEKRIMKFYKKDEKGKELWRWVVPSPNPIDIIEIDIIDNNIKAGIIPIAVGGGGIPVKKVEPEILNGEEIYRCNYDIIYKRKYNTGQQPINIYTGVEAVIDKDLASSLLGTMLIDKAIKRNEMINAELFIFTDVDGVKLNYQKPDQMDLRFLSLKDTEELYDKRIFPAGSMEPKIKAAINFLKGGGKKVYITKVDLYYETLAGKAGTTIAI